MRVALFASGGEIPTCALRALSGSCTVVAVIRPAPPQGLLARLRRVARHTLRGVPPDALGALARELSVPELTMRTARDATIASQLRALRLDLACIATFPWPLPIAVLEAPRLGTVNVHASLLPRHRGPNPWFWTYHADDRETGVTVHVAEARVDRGAILSQARWPLPRGHSVTQLHREVAERGAALLPTVIQAVGAQQAQPEPQDEARVTRAPRVARGTPMLDVTWPVERTWHFLAGLVEQYREPLLLHGRAIRYSQVPGYEVRPPEGPPGTVQRTGDGAWLLWCADGAVRLRTS